MMRSTRYAVVNGILNVAARAYMPISGGPMHARELDAFEIAYPTFDQMRDDGEQQAAVIEWRRALVEGVVPDKQSVKAALLVLQR